MSPCCDLPPSGPAWITDSYIRGALGQRPVGTGRRLLPHQGAGTGVRQKARRPAHLHLGGGPGRLPGDRRRVRGQPQRPPLPALQDPAGAGQTRDLRKAPVLPQGPGGGAPGHRQRAKRRVSGGHHVPAPAPAEDLGGGPFPDWHRVPGEDRLLPALLQAGRLPERGAAQHLQPRPGDRGPDGSGGSTASTLLWPSSASRRASRSTP